MGRFSALPSVGRPARFRGSRSGARECRGAGSGSRSRSARRDTPGSTGEARRARRRSTPSRSISAASSSTIGASHHAQCLGEPGDAKQVRAGAAEVPPAATEPVSLTQPATSIPQSSASRPQQSHASGTISTRVPHGHTLRRGEPDRQTGQCRITRTGDALAAGVFDVVAVGWAACCFPSSSSSSSRSRCWSSRSGRPRSRRPRASIRFPRTPPAVSGSEDEFAQAEAYQEQWREEEKKHPRDTII